MTFAFYPDWQVPPIAPPMPLQAIHVWRANLDVAAPQLQSLAQLLSPDEYTRSQRLRPPHQARLIASRGMLRIILGRYLQTKPERLQFGYEPRGKPVLNYPPCRFQFNLSHSQAMLLCAVTIDHPVGIDLEFIRPTADLEQLTERFFLPQEHHTIHALPPEQRLYAFFQHWTGKEAVLKALGVGLAGLESVEVAFTNGVAKLMRLGDDTAPAWQLHSFSPAPDCLAAIAVQDSLKPIEFWDWQPV